MTKTEAIALAQRAGYPHSNLNWNDQEQAFLMRFAALVAEAEREACAKICEAHAYGWEKNPGNNPIAGFIAASNCAGDIRLRSNAGYAAARLEIESLRGQQNKDTQ